MGQQQLVLLVLTVVIVGVAILLGINAYSESNSRANYDALLTDIVRIAGDAQLWKDKPEVLGGSNDSQKSAASNFLGANFLNLGYAGDKIYGDAAQCYANINGQYEIIAFFGGLAVLARNTSNETLVVGIVTGRDQDDIDLIGILRDGVLLTTGTRWDGVFPTLPNC